MTIEHAESRTAADVARSLGVAPDRGLAPAEVAQRRAAAGPNRLRSVERRESWVVLIEQLRSPLVLLLVAGTVLSAAFDRWVEALAIGVVVILNALLGFATEIRAVRSMEALRMMARVTARVRRDGRVLSVHAAELVPGDVVILEAGDVVTADVRIVEASRLAVDESALTGESVPVDKSADSVSPETPLAERTSMLFKGTAVVRGAAEGIVVATGMDTELGRIAALVREAESDETPLEERLTRLARQLLWVALAFGALLVTVGVASGRPILLLVETAIALTVATVPEGLPVVATLVLARGMWRMARRNALVEHLHAVETLGSTGVILTDKTGTLTENRMAVEVVVPADGACSGDVLVAGALCNDAHGDVGDPMEVALLRAAREAGIDRPGLLAELPEVREEAFDPAIKMMATVHRAGDGYRVAVKGAPEAVLAACSIDPHDHGRWLSRAHALASDGMRVLAFAEKRVDGEAEHAFSALRFLGMVALVDPPRADVRDALDACRDAGIRVVVVTGDHAATARHVGRAIGLWNQPKSSLTGADLDSASLDELRGADLLARATPEQKLRVIQAHQRAGSVVAMIGDGVNDAPALRCADIGVAMGQRGTQVAREAADMVLSDDRFGTVVEAVAQGRIVFTNIRKFVVYLLSCNLTEVLIIGAASAATATLPLLPLQILYLNLVTDVFPAMALGACEGERGMMRRPPRDPREGLLAGRHWLRVLGWSAVLTCVVLATFGIALGPLGLSSAHAVTMSFVTLGLAQTLHVLNIAEARSPAFLNEVTRNPWVWSAVALCVGLLVAAVYVPGLSDVLGTVPLSAESWLLVATASVVPVVVGTILRSLRRAPAPSGGRPAVRGARPSPREGARVG